MGLFFVFLTLVSVCFLALGVRSISGRITNLPQSDFRLLSEIVHQQLGHSNLVDGHLDPNFSGLFGAPALVPSQRLSRIVSRGSGSDR